MSSKAVFLTLGLLLAIGGLVAVAGILDHDTNPTPPAPSPGGGDPQIPDMAAEPSLKFRASTEGLPLGGEWRGGPVVTDLNGDGHLDIVCCVRKGDGLFAYLGDGKGGFTESIEGFPRNLGYGGSSVADFNADGIPDIAFSTHGAPIQVFLGSKEGKWTLATEGITNQEIMTDLATGDVDNDGDQDIIALAWSEGGLVLFTNKGDCTWETRTLFPDEKNIFGKELQIADVDNDGNLDVVTTFFGPKVFFGNGKAEFENRSLGLPVPLTGGVFQGVATTDLDGDGKLEVGCVSMALAEERLLGIGVFRLTEKGSWASISEGLPRGDHYYAIDFADMNHDGNIDLIASGVTNRVEIFPGKDDGTWGAGITIPESSKRAVLGVGDFNHDGRNDLLEVYSFRPGGVRVWLQEPTLQARPQ